MKIFVFSIIFWIRCSEQKSRSELVVLVEEGEVSLDVKPKSIRSLVESGEIGLDDPVLTQDLIDSVERKTTLWQPKMNERWQGKTFRDALKGLGEFDHSEWRNRADHDPTRVRRSTEEASESYIFYYPNRVGEYDYCRDRISVRDQFSCGSCYIFAPIQHLEDRLCRVNMGYENYGIGIPSTQYILDCDEGYGFTCAGASASAAFNYIEYFGSPMDDCYKYKNAKTSCPTSCSSDAGLSLAVEERFKCDEGSSRTYNSNLSFETVKRIVEEDGPMVAYMMIYNDFYAYSSGVYHHVSGGEMGAHVVEILGWGKADDTVTDVWFVKNSWGSDWGEDGFVQILRDGNERTELDFGIWTYECVPEACPHACDGVCSHIEHATCNRRGSCVAQDECVCDDPLLYKPPFCSCQVDNCVECATVSSHCDQCHVGYYENSGQCLPCSDIHTKCAACSSSGSVVCTECEKGSWLQSSTQCVDCEVNYCEECENDGTSCIECSEGFYLSDGDCIPFACPDTGPESCQHCEVDTECLVCDEGYWLYDAVTCDRCFQSECLLCAVDGDHFTRCSKCSTGYYVSHSQHCEACSQIDENCLECVHSRKCTLCKSGFYADQYGACSECPSNCIECSRINMCESCSSGYYLDSGSCNTCQSLFSRCVDCSPTKCFQCEDGWYPESNVCTLCDTDFDPNCEVCSDYRVCTDCSFGMAPNALGVCESCTSTLPNCRDCTDYETCLECEEGYYVAYDFTCQPCGVDEDCSDCWHTDTICVDDIIDYGTGHVRTFEEALAIASPGSGIRRILLYKEVITISTKIIIDSSSHEIGTVEEPIIVRTHPHPHPEMGYLGDVLLDSPEGSIELSQEYWIFSGGESRNLIYKCYDTHSNVCILVAAAGVSFENMTIVHTAVATPSTTIRFSLFDRVDNRIQNVEIEGVGGFTYSGVTVVDSNAIPVHSKGVDILVDGLTYNGIYHYGLYCYSNCRRIAVKNSNFSSCVLDGIRITSCEIATGIVITDNVMASLPGYDTTRWFLNAETNALLGGDSGDNNSIRIERNDVVSRSRVIFSRYTSVSSPTIVNLFIKGNVFHSGLEIAGGSGGVVGTIDEKYELKIFIEGNFFVGDLTPTSADHEGMLYLHDLCEQNVLFVRNNVFDGNFAEHESLLLSWEPEVVQQGYRPYALYITHNLFICGDPVRNAIEMKGLNIGLFTDVHFVGNIFDLTCVHIIENLDTAGQFSMNSSSFAFNAMLSSASIINRGSFSDVFENVLLETLVFEESGDVPFPFYLQRYQLFFADVFPSLTPSDDYNNNHRGKIIDNELKVTVGPFEPTTDDFDYCPVGTYSVNASHCLSCSSSEHCLDCSSASTCEHCIPGYGIIESQCEQCQGDCVNPRGEWGLNCTCDCFGGWEGNHCELCPEYTPEKCNKNQHQPGIIISDGPNEDCTSCDCGESNWEGEFCDVCNLDRVNDCNNNGFVNMTSCSCVCDTNGFQGEFCDFCPMTREDNCNGNGEPRSDTCRFCDCDNEWFGVYCKICGVTREDDCNGRGKGDAECLFCDCDVNEWTGNYCEECPIDSSEDCNDRGIPNLAECMSGDCVNCTGMWGGSHCESCTMTEADCNFDGIPTETCDSCYCARYKGLFCEIRECSNGFSRSEDCNDRGDPRDDCENCLCDYGFVGKNCEYVQSEVEGVRSCQPPPLLAEPFSSQQGDTACVYHPIPGVFENWEAVDDLLAFAANESIRTIYIQGGLYDLEGSVIEFALPGGSGRSFAEQLKILPFPGERVDIFNSLGDDLVVDQGEDIHGNATSLDNAQIGSREDDSGMINFEGSVRIMEGVVTCLEFYNVIFNNIEFFDKSAADEDSVLVFQNCEFRIHPSVATRKSIYLNSPFSLFVSVEDSVFFNSGPYVKYGADNKFEVVGSHFSQMNSESFRAFNSDSCKLVFAENRVDCSGESIRECDGISLVNVDQSYLSMQRNKFVEVDNAAFIVNNQHGYDPCRIIIDGNEVDDSEMLLYAKFLKNPKIVVSNNTLRSMRNCGVHSRQNKIYDKSSYFHFYENYVDLHSTGIKGVGFLSDGVDEGEVIVRRNEFVLDSSEWLSTVYFGVYFFYFYGSALITENTFRKGGGGSLPVGGIYAYGMYDFNPGDALEVRDNVFENEVRRAFDGYYFYHNLVFNDNRVEDGQIEVEYWGTNLYSLEVQRNYFRSTGDWHPISMNVRGDALIKDNVFVDDYGGSSNGDNRFLLNVHAITGKLEVSQNVFYHGDSYAQPGGGGRLGFLRIEQYTDRSVQIYHNVFKCYPGWLIPDNQGDQQALVFVSRTDSTLFEFINNVVIDCSHRDGTGTLKSERDDFGVGVENDKVVFAGNWANNFLSFVEGSQSFELGEGNHYASSPGEDVPTAAVFDTTNPPYFYPLNVIPGANSSEMSLHLATDFEGIAREEVCGGWCGHKTNAGAFTGRTCALVPQNCSGLGLPDLNDCGSESSCVCFSQTSPCQHGGRRGPFCECVDCDENWSGTYCETCELTPNCVNGAWNQTECGCDCELNCMNEGSQLPDCSKCTGCSDNFGGDQCETCMLSNSSCNDRGTPNGDCSGCNCHNPNLSGTFCELCLLSFECENGGTPNSDCSACESCDNSYTGTLCEVCGLNCKFSSYQNEDCSKCECDLNRTVCNNRGVPNTDLCFPDDCTCDEPVYWGGQNCEICVLDCGSHNNNGYPSADCTSCICSNSWTGESCDICLLTREDDCNGVGDPNTVDCIDNQCVDCQGRWTGGDCSVCEFQECVHGHGDLENCDTCVCEDEWTGDRCDICPLLHPRAPKLCLSGVCSQLWTGDLCDECALLHPKYEDKCRPRQCEPPWTGTLCSECPREFHLFKRGDKKETCELWKESLDTNKSQQVLIGVGVSTSIAIVLAIVVGILVVVLITILLVYVQHRWKSGRVIAPYFCDVRELRSIEISPVDTEIEQVASAAAPIEHSGSDEKKIQFKKSEKPIIITSPENAEAKRDKSDSDEDSREYSESSDSMTMSETESEAEENEETESECISMNGEERTDTNNTSEEAEKSDGKDQREDVAGVPAEFACLRIDTNINK